jgi:hypothetical protein
MTTRLIFVALALAILGGFWWAYRHDQKLEQNAAMVNVGDPNEAVRDLLGNPSSEGSCGSMGVAPSACTDEYVYKYYYSIFQPKYEVIWFSADGKVIGQQHVQRAF